MTGIRRTSSWLAALVLLLGGGVVASAPATAVVTSAPAPDVPDQSVDVVAHQVGSVALAYSLPGNPGGDCETIVFSSTSPLPDGLTLSDTGVLSGAMLAEDPQSFTVRARIYHHEDLSGPDFNECVSPYDTATIMVNPSPNPIDATDKGLPDPQYGVPYSETAFDVSGGTAPYTWAFVEGGGSVPGLSIDPATGVVAGTTTVAFSDLQLLVRATDSTGASYEDRFELFPYHRVPNQRVTFRVGQPGAVQLDAEPHKTGVSYAWSPLTAVPDGLTLDADGVLHGTLAEGGTQKFTVTVRGYASCLDTDSCPGTTDPRIWAHDDAAVITVVDGRHRSRVTIEYRRRAQAFTGAVTAGGPAGCTRQRTVKVFRARRGNDRQVGRDTTGANGRYWVPAANPHGRFYAVVVRRHVGPHTCLRDRSPVIRR